MPAEDEAVLEECLGPDFDKGNEDVIEFLSSLKCFSIPSSDNIKDIINEIAQKELIQQPKYIVHCWAPVVSQLTLLLQFSSI